MHVVDAARSERPSTCYQLGMTLVATVEPLTNLHMYQTLTRAAQATFFPSLPKAASYDSQDAAELGRCGSALTLSVDRCVVA